MEFRSKMRLLRLKTPDNAQKTLYVDEGKTVDELMVYICNRLRITSNNEFSLAREEREKANYDVMRGRRAREMMDIRSKLRTEDTGF